MTCGSSHHWAGSREGGWPERRAINPNLSLTGTTSVFFCVYLWPSAARRESLMGTVPNAAPEPGSQAHPYEICVLLCLSVAFLIRV